MAFMEKLAETWLCRPMRGMLAVTSPFHTLDGDRIEVYVKFLDDGTAGVTDFGETMRYLTGHGLGLDSEIRQDFVEQIVGRFGITMKDHRLTTKVPAEDVAQAVHDLLEASRFMVDLVFTARPQEESAFAGAVEQYLRLWVKKVDVKPNLKGASGRTYKPDFRAMDRRDVWIEAIASASRSSLTEQVNRTFAMWSDASPSVRRLTLVDTSSLAFDPESVDFLKNVSPVLSLENVEAVREHVLAETMVA